MLPWQLAREILSKVLWSVSIQGQTKGKADFSPFFYLLVFFHFPHIWNTPDTQAVHEFKTT